MSITVLNNISDLTAENALGNTQMNLQKTLTQLSTGMKINSGSDDAAGLSIANGMTANIAALTQSQQNASNGVGLLQTADGALSQVTTLLNRAVTIATEGSSNDVTSTQYNALNTEFTSILSEVNQIGQTTNFNGQNVFANNTLSTFTSSAITTSPAGAVATTSGAASGASLTVGSKTTITDANTGGTFTYTASTGGKVSDLAAAITAAVTSGTLSTGTALTVGQVGTTATYDASISNIASSGITVTTNDAALGAFSGTSSNTQATNNVFISDGSTANSTINTNITTSINALTSGVLGLSTQNLSSATGAQAALTAVNAAINSVSAQRGSIGASVNRLNAATTVMADQVTNLQSAVNSLQNADIGTTVANMTQYNVLESTGMAALQQANQAQQAVLKLVQ